MWRFFKAFQVIELTFERAFVRMTPGSTHDSHPEFLEGSAAIPRSHSGRFANFLGKFFLFQHIP